MHPIIALLVGVLVSPAHSSPLDFVPRERLVRLHRLSATILPDSDLQTPRREVEEPPQAIVAQDSDPLTSWRDVGLGELPPAMTRNLGQVDLAGLAPAIGLRRTSHIYNLYSLGQEQEAREDALERSRNVPETDTYEFGYLSFDEDDHVSNPSCVICLDLFRCESTLGDPGTDENSQSGTVDCSFCRARYHKSCFEQWEAWQLASLASGKIPTCSACKQICTTEKHLINDERVHSEKGSKDKHFDIRTRCKIRSGSY